MFLDVLELFPLFLFDEALSFPAGRSWFEEAALAFFCDRNLKKARLVWHDCQIANVMLAKVRHLRFVTNENATRWRETQKMNENGKLLVFPVLFEVRVELTANNE